jgi:hypothetical protein
MARKLFPGAGYFLHLIDTYCSNEDTLRDALGELTFYYEFYTPQPSYIVREWKPNVKLAQQEGVEPTSECPYDYSFEDYIKDGRTQSPLLLKSGLLDGAPQDETLAQASVFIDGFVRSSKHLKSSQTVKNWFYRMLLRGVTVEDVQELVDNGTQMHLPRKDEDGFTAKSFAEQYLTAAGRDKLRTLAEIDDWVEAYRTPFALLGNQVPARARYNLADDLTTTFTGLDGNKYTHHTWLNFAAKTELTTDERAYITWIWDTHGPSKAFRYLALYSPRTVLNGLSPVAQRSGKFEKVTGLETAPDCPYLIPFEAVHDPATGTILTPAELTNTGTHEEEKVEPAPETTTPTDTNENTTEAPETPKEKPEPASNPHPAQEKETEDPIVLTIPAPTPGTLAEAINKTSDTTIHTFLSRITGTNDITTKPVEEVLQLAGTTLTDVLKTTGITTRLANGTVSELAHSAGVEEMDVIMSGLT